MSLDEFLAWEREQPDRHEFDGFTIVAMTGGSLDHSTIASNFDRALSAKLRGSRCRVFRGDTKVIANGSVRLSGRFGDVQPGKRTRRYGPRAGCNH